MDNNARIGALKESLNDDSTKLPDSLSELFKARLLDLTLEDSHHQMGISLSSDTDSLVDNVYDEVFVSRATGDYDKARLISNLAVTGFIDLNNSKPNIFGKQNFSIEESKPLVELMEESDYGYLGALALSRQEMSFDKATVNQLGDIADYLKKANSDTGENAKINYEKLMQGFVVSKQRLENDIKTSDSSSLSNTLANLTAHTTYNEISSLMSNNPDVSYLVYNSVGKEFTSYIYDTAVNEKNANYAMSLLLNRKSGVLIKGDIFASSDKKVKQLLSVIAQDEDSTNKLQEVVGTAKTAVEKTIVIESIVDSHNGLYLPEQLEQLFEDNLDNLSQSQVEQIGYKLLKNSGRQPVGRALNKLLEVASKENFDMSQLRQEKVEQERELKQKIQELDKPLSAYSSVTLNDSKTNRALAVRDMLSPTHLDYIFENDFDVEISEMRIIGSESLLDQKVKTAIMDYLETGNKEVVSDVLVKPIHEAYKDDNNRTRLLHEACYQDSQLPRHSEELENLLVSNVVSDDHYVRNNNQPIIGLSELRDANNLRDALIGIDVGDITVDDTDLGREFDEALNDSVKNFSNEQHNKAYEDALNRIVGLPLNFSSSKIDENQVKFKKTQQSNSNISESGPKMLTEEESNTIDSNANTGLPRSHK